MASDFVNRPVNFVTYWSACRFANWLHNGQPTGPEGPSTTERGAYTLDGYNGEYGSTIQRNIGARWFIPSEDEWYKAAYYKGGGTNAGYWDYPTGSDTAPGQDMADASGDNANYYAAPYAYPIDSGKFTTVAGEFQNSASPYGTFDQGGNVEEWNESVTMSLDDGYGLRGQRGGSFNEGYGTLRASWRDHGGPSDSSWLIGFRVAESPDGWQPPPATPEPSSLIVLGTGILALAGMIRRRR